MDSQILMGSHTIREVTSFPFCFTLLYCIYSYIGKSSIPCVPAFTFYYQPFSPEISSTSDCACQQKTRIFQLLLGSGTHWHILKTINY